MMTPVNLLETTAFTLVALAGVLDAAGIVVKRVDDLMKACKALFKTETPK